MPPIVQLGSAWPWPVVSDFRDRWHESTQEHHEYGLGVLPPIYFPGGFFVSEAATHDRRGVPVYAAWVEIGGRYFVREIPRDKHAEALAELRAELAKQAAPVPDGHDHSRWCAYCSPD